MNVPDASRVVRLHAKVVSLCVVADPLAGHDRSNTMCNVEVYNEDGSVNCKLMIDRAEAADHFNLARDPLLYAGSERVVDASAALRHTS